jgi:hypothetical protein
MREAMYLKYTPEEIAEWVKLDTCENRPTPGEYTPGCAEERQEHGPWAVYDPAGRNVPRKGAITLCVPVTHAVTDKRSKDGALEHMIVEQAGGAIWLQFRPDRGGTELVALCEQPEVTDYFDSLINKIRERYAASAPTTPTSDAGGGQRDINNKVTEILAEIRQQRIEQGEIQKLLDAIRRALEYVLRAGLPTDVETKERLGKIYRAVNSDLSLQQKLELSLPIVPHILEYKVEIGAGEDVGAAMEELRARLKKRSR